MYDFLWDINSYTNTYFFHVNFVCFSFVWATYIVCNPLSEAFRKALIQEMIEPDVSKAVTAFLGNAVQLQCSERALKYCM